MESFFAFLSQNFVAAMISVVGVLSGLVTIVEFFRSLFDKNGRGLSKAVISTSLLVFFLSALYLAGSYQSAGHEELVLSGTPSPSDPNQPALPSSSQTEPSASLSPTATVTQLPSPPSATKTAGSADTSVSTGTSVSASDGAGSWDNNAQGTSGSATVVPTVTKVTLDYTKLTLTVGETVDLNATVLCSDGSQNGSVTWISSNPAVAKVDNQGQVTGADSGTAEITVQATRNQSSREAVCTVVVSAPPSGYTIRLSTQQAAMGEIFRVYVDPYDSDVTEIWVHAQSPTGANWEYRLTENGKGYYIDTETGQWTIWATLKNAAGTYTPSRPSEYATIEILPLSDLFEGAFSY